MVLRCIARFVVQIGIAAFSSWQIINLLTASENSLFLHGTSRCLYFWNHHPTKHRGNINKPGPGMDLSSEALDTHYGRGRTSRVASARKLRAAKERHHGGQRLRHRGETIKY